MFPGEDRDKPSQDGAERDYFEIMSNMQVDSSAKNKGENALKKSKSRNDFKDFLDDSFKSRKSSNNSTSQILGKLDMNASTNSFELALSESAGYSSDLPTLKCVDLGTDQSTVGYF